MLTSAVAGQGHGRACGHKHDPEWLEPHVAHLLACQPGPFFMTEFYTPDDTNDDFYQLNYRLGLNFKPSTYVTLKMEANRSIFPRSKLLDDLWGFLGQVSVSF